MWPWTSSESTRLVYDMRFCEVAASAVQGDQLPSSLYREMDIYLNTIKKKISSAQKRGEVDYQAADPIPVRLIL